MSIVDNMNQNYWTRRMDIVLADLVIDGSSINTILQTLPPPAGLIQQPEDLQEWIGFLAKRIGLLYTFGKIDCEYGNGPPRYDS